MKVPGAPSAVPATGTEAAEQFTDIYRQHHGRLVRYLAWVLNTPYHPLAEDLAQETLLALWVDYVAADGLREPEKVYGLLKVIARNRVHEHFKASRNHESTVDLGDRANQHLTGAGHGYALGIPEVAALVTDLDTAMDRMSQASEKWRALNKESARLRLQLTDGYRDHLGGLAGETRAKHEQRAADVELQEESALVDFREICRQVGQLRADIEQAAGPNWRSVVGMPVGQAPHAPLSYAKDPSATHCTKGHPLDRLNTAYTAAGERRCRACAREKNLRSKPRQATPSSATARISDDVIERARELLADPVLGHSIRSVASLLGVSQMTLYRAFPGGVAAVRRAALVGADR